MLTGCLSLADDQKQSGNEMRSTLSQFTFIGISTSEPPKIISCSDMTTSTRQVCPVTVRMVTNFGRWKRSMARQDSDGYVLSLRWIVQDHLGISDQKSFRSLPQPRVFSNCINQIVSKSPSLGVVWASSGQNLQGAHTHSLPKRLTSGNDTVFCSFLDINTGLGIPTVNTIILFRLRRLVRLSLRLSLSRLSHLQLSLCLPQYYFHHVPRYPRPGWI